MNHKIYLGLVALGLNAAAQVPTGTPSGPVPATAANTTKAWFRGGNLPGSSGATDNIFGTALIALFG